MPTFTYKARDRSGQAVTGKIEAQSEKEIFKDLSELGYFVSSIKPKGRSAWDGVSGVRGKVSAVDLIFFTRQLAAMLDAGIPINTGLNIIANQGEGKTMVQVAKRLRQNVEEGMGIAQAMGNESNVFDRSYIAMVEVGESGGKIAEMLNRLADLLELKQERRAKVKAAVTYPVILVIAATIGITFLVVFVFPMFVKIFEKANVALPLPTRILIGVSNFVRGYWWALLGGSGGVVIFATKYAKTLSGRLFFDRIKLKLPIFGNLFRKVAVSAFAHSYRALNVSGVPLVTTLRLVAEAVGNSVIAQAIEKARIRISEGSSIASSFGESRQFPGIVVEMISVGEESGKMDEMLSKISQYYDKEVDYVISKLTTTLEPILLAAMGAVVAIMYLSLIMPMTQLLKVIRGGGLG
jgi:type IV pilus assembly protein PilC